MCWMEDFNVGLKLHLINGKSWERSRLAVNAACFVVYDVTPLSKLHLKLYGIDFLSDSTMSVWLKAQILVALCSCNVLYTGMYAYMYVYLILIQ